jgi:hypothetical protein
MAPRWRNTVHKAMTKFVELLRIDGSQSVADQQAYASQQLPILLSGTSLHKWKPGDAISTKGLRMLLGVASYSPFDLQLLDLLNEKISPANNSSIQVDVFNVLECTNMEDFSCYIPGIAKVYQTPVVGIWKDGVLFDQAWGRAARDLIGRILGLEIPVPT